MSVGKLTGPKKAAILLLALGEDAAADVMKNLEESEIQQVGYYMSRFTDVAPEELDLVRPSLDWHRIPYHRVPERDAPRLIQTSL